jgi:hypothetical protein
MRTREIKLRATEHRSAHEALQHLEVSGDDRAISVGGKYLTLSQAEADRLATMGVEFAYLIHHRPTGRIMTIPVNER